MSFLLWNAAGRLSGLGVPKELQPRRAEAVRARSSPHKPLGVSRPSVACFTCLRTCGHCFGPTCFREWPSLSQILFSLPPRAPNRPCRTDSRLVSDPTARPAHLCQSFHSQCEPRPRRAHPGLPQTAGPRRAGRRHTDVRLLTRPSVPASVVGMGHRHGRRVPLTSVCVPRGRPPPSPASVSPDPLCFRFHCHLPLETWNLVSKPGMMKQKGCVLEPEERLTF